MEQGVVVWGWWELCVQSSARSDTESQRETGGNNSRMSNTQLDSLLYPGDERSATWALPHCDLAPFGDSESCTHVHISHNNTTEAPQTACTHSYSALHSAQCTLYICHWQMVFRSICPTHLFTQKHGLGLVSILHRSWGLIPQKYIFVPCVHAACWPGGAHKETAA